MQNLHCLCPHLPNKQGKQCLQMLTHLKEKHYHPVLITSSPENTAWSGVERFSIVESLKKNTK